MNKSLAWRPELARQIAPLHQLLEETITLAAQALPDIDFTGARKGIDRRRTAVLPDSLTL